MQSTMMDLPLSTQMIFRHGARLHGGSAVRSFDGERIGITLYEDVARHAESLANALSALGVQRGERVATFCWNHRQHLEAYLAVPAMGAVLHTLNIRLFPEQVAKIMAHADDRVLIADASLLPQLAPHLGLVPGLKHVILVGGGAVDLPTTMVVSDYEALLAAHAGAFAWPELQERDAAVVCYTTGTTGDPKGIV